MHRIAPGTEDVNSESLAWRPITAENESVQVLAQFLPAEEWLAMPVAMYEAVEAYVRQRARETGSPTPPPRSVAEGSSTPYSHAIVKWLSIELLVLRHAWQTGRVTREDVAAICGISFSEAKRVLRKLAREGYLVRHGKKKKSRWYDTLENVDPVWVEFRRDPGFVPPRFKYQDSKPLVVSRSREFFAQAGISYVLYTRLKRNLKFVMRDDLSAREKAQRLAQLAVESVTPETFRENRDGICYLADAIRHGIHPPLTEPYKLAILRLAGNAPDLETARRRIAHQKGIHVGSFREGPTDLRDL